MVQFLPSSTDSLVAAPVRRWRRAMLRLGGMIVLLGLAVSVGTAADHPAKLQVAIVDQKNQPVAAAEISVTLADKAVATAETDQDGKAEIEVLAAGTYQLSISKKGFITADTEVEVVENREAPGVDVVLGAVDLSEQSVEVKSTGENAVTDDSGITQTVPIDTAKVSPTKPITLTDALPLIPGIGRGQDGSVKIAGFGEDHSALLVNSVDVTDPATGNFGLSIPIDSVDTVQVSVMPYLAQYGRFTAGVVTAQTRPGGAQWELSRNNPFPEWRDRSGQPGGAKHG